MVPQLKCSNHEVAKVSESEMVQNGWAMRKWRRYAEVYVVYGGHRNKFGEKLTENGAVAGDVATRGRMSEWIRGRSG